jgi:hypothetical protein
MLCLNQACGSIRPARGNHPLLTYGVICVKCIGIQHRLFATGLHPARLDFSGRQVDLRLAVMNGMIMPRKVTKPGLRSMRASDVDCAIRIQRSVIAIEKQSKGHATIDQNVNRLLDFFPLAVIHTNNKVALAPTLRLSYLLISSYRCLSRSRSSPASRKPAQRKLRPLRKGHSVYIRKP